MNVTESGTFSSVIFTRNVSETLSLSARMNQKMVAIITKIRKIKAL